MSIILGRNEIVIGVKNLRCCITKEQICNQALPFRKMYHYSENMIKGNMGAKVKVFLQGLHMTCVSFMSVYNLKICILGTPFNITF